jgi:isopentenyldiphosphate isomerase
MPDEIFDVVNERDEVVAQRPRHEVHRLGLRHRAIHVLVFNARGEVFLQKRSATKDREPGVWDSSCSGHLDHGEDYDQAAQRELGEELGWQPPSPPQRLFKLPASPATDQEFVWVYRCAGEGPFRLHPEEIETGGWFTPERLQHWLAEQPAAFASAFRHLWPRITDPPGSV